jgi:signal transduction histidine kinase/serine/threonine protein kinase
MIIDSRYEVINRLGTGLWSTVYQVHDMRTNKILALKYFENITTQKFYDNFSAEDMHHVTKIIHQNLVRVYDFGVFKKHIYLVSEFYAGVTLNHFYFKSFRIDMIYDIIVKICYALNALHNQNILHLDLKPGNILYILKGKSVDLKVLDYGLLRSDINEDQQTITGTLPYIAPEIISKKKFDKRSDFYSLGVILYKISTGILPFTTNEIIDFRRGKLKNLFPRFPRDINPDIPVNLEKLILKLLEVKPENRLANAESIIKYINKFSRRRYPYSDKKNMINSIQFSSYLVREDYSHELTSFIPIIEESNGKIITIISGYGAGKNNILTLFRYHILNDEYFIFDYVCSIVNADPFFALIREYFSYLNQDKMISKELEAVSEKFRQFIFRTSDYSKINTNAKDLKFDFEIAKKIILELSKIKPIIFIIRSGEFLTDETVQFINYISDDIRKSRILLIVSVNNPLAVKKMVHQSKITIQPLTFLEVKKYIHQLINIEPPDIFVKNILKITNGNPKFIQEVLHDLTNRKLIWDNGRFDLSYDFDSYILPKSISKIIFNQLGHLELHDYQNIKKMSVIDFPINKKIISYLLSLDEKSTYFFLQNVVTNEIYIQFEGKFNFTYFAIKKKLFNELTDEEKKAVSKKILKYYDNKQLEDEEICSNLVKISYFAHDIFSVRRYKKKLLELYARKYDQEKSYYTIRDIIKIDFSGKINLNIMELKKDLRIFREKIFINGFVKRSYDFLITIKNLPDIFEVNYLWGTIYQGILEYSKALTHYEKAYQQAVTGKEIIISTIEMSWILLQINNVEKAKIIIDELDPEQMNENLKISYYDRKAIILDALGHSLSAIEIVEEFIPTIIEKNDIGLFYRLGSLYNNLAYIYSNLKMIEQAEINYKKAKNIWERIHYYRSLPTIYNNIGDIALRKGDIAIALKYFEQSHKLCLRIDQKRGLALSYLNFGEAYIKKGEFENALSYLNASQRIIDSSEDRGFSTSIKANKALIYAKINNFYEYYNFIKNEIEFNNINEINPMIKSYFYFLINVGQHKKLERIFNNLEINFFEIQEEEFYYQIKGILNFENKDYKKAITNFKMGLSYATKRKSVYAQTIFYIKLAEAAIFIKDMEEVNKYFDNARKLAENYNFGYWLSYLKLLQVQIQLMDSSIPLRLVMRNVVESLQEIRRKKYFLLEFKSIIIRTEIFILLKSEKKSHKFYNITKQKALEITKDLPKEFIESFLTKYKCNFDEPSHLSSPLAKMRTLDKLKWEEDLYELLTLRDTKRIMFFVDRIINNVVAPYSYAIILQNSLTKHEPPFFVSDSLKDEIYSENYLSAMELVLAKSAIIKKNINGKNVVFLTFGIKTSKIGIFVLTDNGEMEFSNREISKISKLRLHLTSILSRITEYDRLNNQMKMMNDILEISEKIFSISNLTKLEQEIVISSIKITNAKRGFFIKHDKAGNYVFNVGIDSDQQYISDESKVSKTVLSEARKNNLPIYTNNAVVDNLLKNSISVQDYELHSIYCLPILTHNEFYGFLYLDDYQAENMQMHIYPAFMDIMKNQISIALEKAIQFENIVRKSKDLSKIDTIKKEFVNIVSHELNTPLVTLKGVVSRIKRDNFKSEDEKKETVLKLQNAVDKLSNITSDILTFNKYLITEKLNLVVDDVKEIFELIIDEANIIAANRHMNISLEIEDDLPKAEINWEAFHLMIYNIVLNSIRYSKDFGKIIIGCRKSAFQTEEVKGKKSIVITVKDEGIGIQEDELEAIFTSFYESRDIYSHSSGVVEYGSSGLGLGLSIVKRIVDLHFGKIWLKSEENVGTTVFISIPAFKNNNIKGRLDD